MGFPSTQWSLIVASGDREAARAAWSELATHYRAPIHAWFRSRYGAERADDLTSAFFAASIEGGWWSRADLARGSFRTYLRMLLSRFGARHAHAYTFASGPGAADDGAIEHVRDAGDEPDAAYDRAFAQAVIARVLARLRAEAGEGADVQALWPHLFDRGAQGDLKALAGRLGLAQNTLLQRLRRLRLKLRDLLREEFATLVVDPASIDDELRALRQALEGG